MRFFLIIIVLFLLISYENKKQNTTTNFSTHFEATDGTETATYDQVVDFYLKLAREFPEINIQTVGETDSGYPLHLVTYNKDGDFDFKKIADTKATILINNGIHPGESDGIDATMLLYRDLALGKIESPRIQFSLLFQSIILEGL